jgi:hypothetical protein
MNEYGKGLVGVATTLPATSAAGLMLADKVHPIIAVGFVVVNSILLIMLAGHISRYMFNK